MSQDRAQGGAQSTVAKVDALLNPRNVVIVGATDKPGNWPQRVLRNLKRFDDPKPIYPFNPTRDSVWDMRCYRAFTDLPDWLKQVASVFPLKWIAQGMRSVFFPGDWQGAEMAGTWEHGRTALVLAAWLVAGLVLCVRTFRWTKRGTT